MHCFIDLLDTDPKVGNDLGIIKVAFVRDSSKCSIAKIQSSGYKARHFLGIAPQESENDNEYRKKWADNMQTGAFSQSEVWLAL